MDVRISKDASNRRNQETIETAASNSGDASFDVRPPPNLLSYPIGLYFSRASRKQEKEIRSCSDCSGTLCRNGLLPTHIPRPFAYTPMVGSLKMNTALEYSTRVVQDGDRRCKKSTINDLAYLTPLRIPLMNPVQDS